MISTVRKTAGVLAAVATLAACSNPVESDRHGGPAAVSIAAGSTTLVEGSATTMSGPIELAVGGVTPLVSVQFREADGEVLATTGYWLKVTSSDPAVVRWTAAAPGAFNGTVTGVAAGLATLRFEYFHGAVNGGHRDGPAFDVSVEVGGAT